MPRLLIPLLLASLAPLPAPGSPPELTSPRIEAFPRQGRGYQLIDWHQRARDFLDFALDPVRTGDYLPLMWWDDSRMQGKETSFGLPSYVGMKGQWGVFRHSHEGIVTLGTLLSGTLLDRDMARFPVPGSPQPVNLVRMQEAYFSPEDGVFLNRIGGASGGSFWYDLMPNLLAGALVASYPGETSLASKWQAACRRWAQASLHLWQLNDYQFQSYDLRRRLALVSRWREPDSAAALAFLMQMAYAKWPEEQTFYHETRHALDWLCAQEHNLNYEFFTAFGVYAAARCNAEHHTDYDVGKLLNWCFEDSAVRGIAPHETDIAKGDGWGVLCGRWGDCDVAGLVGASRGALSTPAFRGGYGFAMETFVYAWPLAAAVRYDNRLARSVGKWLHAAAHSARWFYPDQLPPQRQTDWAWASRHTTAIPYEGLMEKDNRSGAPGPFASGDPTNHGWGPLNLSVYGGAFSGIFGALIRPANAPGVLAIDVCQTDFFPPLSFPATLLYHPGDAPVQVRLPAGDQPVRLWDAVANRWLSDPVTGWVQIEVPPGGAILATFLPADLSPVFSGGKLLCGGRVADYSAAPPDTPP